MSDGAAGDTQAAEDGPRRCECDGHGIGELVGWCGFCFGVYEVGDDPGEQDRSEAIEAVEVSAVSS